MPEQTRARTGYLVLALLIAAASVMIGLGALPLTNPDEGRNAQIAQEMLTTGSFLVPTYNGMTDLDQPALYFDLVAGSLAALGNTEFAARLPSAVFAILTVLLVGLTARRFYGGRAAALAVLVTATTPLFIAFSRTVSVDMALTFFVFTTLFAGFVALEKGAGGSRGWHGLTMLAASLATLTKGPVGFILPLLGLSVYALLTRTKGGRRFFAFDNLLIFLAPIALWFALLSLQVPDFPQHSYGLLKETLERFTSLEELRRGGQYWYYLALIAAVFFPWSMLVPGIGLRSWVWRRQVEHLDVLLMVFALLVVAYFTLTRSRLPGDVMPAVIALAMLTARVFDAALANRQGRAATLVRRSTLLLALLAFTAGGLLAADQLGYLSVPQLLHIDELRYQEAQVLAVPLIAWFLIVGATATVARLSRRITLMFWAFALPVVILAAGASGPLKAYAEGVSSRPLAQALTQAYPQTPEIACLRCYPPGLAYYLGRGLTLVSDDGHEIPSNSIAHDLTTPPWPQQVVRPTGAEAWLRSRTGPVLLLSQGPSPDPWAAQLAEERGLKAREVRPGWWAILVPAPGR